MNLRQLHYFYDAARNQSLAKTAEKYKVPPSAVSASIKRLEEELGVQLFDRTSNKIVLNAKGKILAGELQIALDRIDHAIRQISDTSEENPQLKILIHARSKWIAELITEYRTINPHVSFIISNAYTLTNFDDFDIVIDEEKEAYSNWDRFLLSIEMICVKASCNHPFAEKELTFEQLKDEAFVLPSVGNGMRDLYERCCKKHGMKPNVAIECNERQCLHHYISANMALTLGSYRALSDQTQNDIVPLKVLDFNETQSVYVFYKNTPNIDIHIKEFCDFLYQKRYV